jgi:hypothetical protein
MYLQLKLEANIRLYKGKVRDVSDIVRDAIRSRSNVKAAKAIVEIHRGIHKYSYNQMDQARIKIVLAYPDVILSPYYELFCEDLKTVRVILDNLQTIKKQIQ